MLTTRTARATILGLGAFLASTMSIAQTVAPTTSAPSGPPGNSVVVAGSAPALCWSTPNTSWQINGNGSFNFSAGSGFGGGGALTIPESQLVDANKRAALTFAGNGAFRLRFGVNCNAPVVAKLSAQYGRLQNTSLIGLPTGMPVSRSANGSATFENYYPYQVQYGFVNTLTGATPPTNAQRVNGSAGYTDPLDGASADGPPPSWTAVTSGGLWHSIKRVDVRIDLNPPPPVTGTSLAPVMVAGSYSEQLTLTMTPSL